jgi:hypothetical protein
VSDLAFYNVGCERPRGIRLLVVVPRRILRRILRPIFHRQVELLRELFHRLYATELAVERVERRQDELREGLTRDLGRRQDELDEKLQTLVAMGWDHVAVARRLAALEDQIAVLTGTAPAAADEGDPHPSILFPGLAKASVGLARRDDSSAGPESCARVG